MKIGSINHFKHGDPRLGGKYAEAEFYEVRDGDDCVVARVVREPVWPCYWFAYNTKEEPIARDKYSSDLLDRLERILNDG